MAFAFRTSGTASTPAAGTTLTVPLPSGWVAGDVCYIAIALSAATGVINTPAGWSAVVPAFQGAAGTNGTAAVFRRVLVGGDTDPAITFTSGRAGAASVAIAGVDTTTPEDVTSASDVNTGITWPSIQCPSLTSVTANALLLAFPMMRNGTNSATTSFTPPAGMTELVDVASAVAATSNAGVSVAYLQLTTPGATGLKTATAASSSGTAYNPMGASIILRPETVTVEHVGASVAVNAECATGTGTAYDVTPPIATFIDDFNTGSSLDTGKWDVSGDLGQSSIVSGQLNLSVTNSYPRVKSVQTYTIVNSALYLQAATVPPLGTGTRQMLMTAEDTLTDSYLCIQTVGSLLLYGTRTNSVDSFASVTYDPVAHAWWQIRESGGTVYFEVSSDGSSWSALGTNSTPAWAIHVKPMLVAGFYGGESAATAVYDNVNIVSAVTTSANAECATATGTAGDPTASLATAAECATATAVAGDPTASLAGSTEVATGTGTAGDSTVSLATATACATGTGTASDASDSLATPTECATGTGAAYDAVTALLAADGGASGTGASGDAGPSLAATTEAATGLGAAGDSTIAIVVYDTGASGTGVGNDVTPSVSSSTSAAAECATGTGSASDTVASMAVQAECATGTGTAYDAAGVPAISANAECATATGVASNAAPSLSTTTEAAGATATATDSIESVAANAECATGTGAANDATIATAVATNANAECATGTGVAQDPSATVGVADTGASGVGVSQTPTVILSAADTGATGTGTANDLGNTNAVNADVAAGTGTANDATSITGTVGLAECATGTGIANDPGTAVITNVSSADATGTAQTPTIELGTSASPGLGSGTASDSDSISVVVNVECATATGIAPDAVAGIAGATNAQAEAATGDASLMLRPRDTIGAADTGASATGTANDLGNAIVVNVECATATGDALQPVAGGSNAAPAGVATAFAAITDTGPALAPTPVTSDAAAQAFNAFVDALTTPTGGAFDGSSAGATLDASTATAGTDTSSGATGLDDSSVTVGGMAG